MASRQILTNHGYENFRRSAKQLGQLLDLAQREPVAITRHGRPAACVVSPQDMEPILREKERRRKAVEEFKVISESVLEYQSQFPDLAELTDEEINRILHEVRAERRFSEDLRSR